MAEISGVHVKLTGDTSSLNSALDDAQGELKDTKDDADKTTGSLRNLAKGFAGAAVAAVGIAGIGNLFRNVAREAETLETSMLKIGAVIKATGGTAGRTGDQLLSFARALALSTLESTEGILEAQQRLLTFRKISGDVFDRTIVASTDLAAAMGTSLSGAAVMLGRALEDPVTGLTALTRTGTVFTDKQKDMVKQLVETGKLQDAQRLILKELEAQYGGTAVAAASGYAGALDTLGQRQQEFLLAINDTLKVTEILSAAVSGLANVFESLTRNIGRVISYIAATGLAAMFAFRGAIIGAAAAITRLLIPSLVGLRAAIIRTGIGVLVIGLGELLYQLGRAAGGIKDFVKSMGGIRKSFVAIGQVATEIVGRISYGFRLVGELLDGVAMIIEGSFRVAFGFIAKTFNDNVLVPITKGINLIKQGLNSIPGIDAGEPLPIPTADGQSETGENLMASGRDVVGSAAGSIGDLFSQPLASVERLRELFAQMREEGNTLPDVLGMNTGEGEDDENGGGGGAFEKLDEELTAQEQRIKEHFDRIKALSEGGLSDKLGAWGNYFSNLVSLTGSSNKKLLGLARAFSAAQALVNSYLAYTEVLKDPTLPWFARAAAAGSVLAAGIGAVNSIRSVTAGGGSGGGAAVSSGASSGSGVTSGQAASAVSNQVAISLTGGDMFSRDQVIQLINSINDAVDDGAQIRLV